MADSTRASTPSLPEFTVRVKICGLTRRADAEYAAEIGADYLGVVLVPESPRARSPEQAREIFSGLRAQGAIVSAMPDAEAIVDAAERSGARVLQLHGAETPETVARIREAGPWTIWKAVRVRSRDDAERARNRYEGFVDAFLWDGWHADHLGGSGVVFPWDEVRTVRESLPSEVGLVIAGGLGPENVGEGIARLRPNVVDVSSGVETSPGVKDPARVLAFIRAAQGGRGVFGE